MAVFSIEILGVRRLYSSTVVVSIDDGDGLVYICWFWCGVFGRCCLPCSGVCVCAVLVRSRVVGDVRT